MGGRPRPARKQQCFCACTLTQNLDKCDQERPEIISPTNVDALQRTDVTAFVCMMKGMFSRGSCVPKLAVKTSADGVTDCDAGSVHANSCVEMIVPEGEDVP